MAIIITEDQQFTATIQPISRSGSPAPIDGIPTWGVSDSAVASVIPGADGLSALVVSGVPGMCQVSVSVDADLGAGVRTIFGTLDVEVKPGEAVSVGIVAGATETKP